MNTNAIKNVAREPSTMLGLGFIALALQEFQHGITAVACIKFFAGVCGVLLREGAASAPANGTQSTNMEVSASLKKEVRNGNTNHQS
jgi:hypothetical protein